MAVSGLILAAALLAMDPDGIVVTAPATTVDLGATVQPVAASTEGATQDAVPHGLSTDQQIDRWIAGRSTADKPWAEAANEPVDDRKPHGEVSVSIGTGGYRDYGVAVSLPLGENGRLDLRYRQVENGYPYGGYGGGYDHPYFDDSGYAFPGYPSPQAAGDYESRLMRPGGPPRRYPLVQPNRADGD
ncbi:MAG: hypothetical protein Q7U72_11335 [Brevundimonas sp.]|uniref:hypothetical protein n=1 Tax=Brevundimonas sp. TaxID=1871086 RepID=UPI0027255CDB|nr:hypothetical protein [Brevundimonas sp.]MDO9078023.1 hypothetical protein [Brevundimonas sp.]MDP3080636.1 hypothetical protein [Brevundimonas sp.]MDZ4060143.1 hypothetical protein [Brevundimonas sp.]